LKDNYFLRVKKLSPTRFWINNPTPGDADKAIVAGAISCTTNPTYAMKQILREDEKDYVLHVVDEVIKDIKDNNEACNFIQQRLVKRILEKFFPLMRRIREKKDLYLSRVIHLLTMTQIISLTKHYNVVNWVRTLLQRFLQQKQA